MIVSNFKTSYLEFHGRKRSLELERISLESSTFEPRPVTHKYYPTIKPFHHLISSIFLPLTPSISLTFKNSGDRRRGGGRRPAVVVAAAGDGGGRFSTRVTTFPTILDILNVMVAAVFAKNRRFRSYDNSDESPAKFQR